MMLSPPIIGVHSRLLSGKFVRTGDSRPAGRCARRRSHGSGPAGARFFRRAVTVGLAVLLGIVVEQAVHRQLHDHLAAIMVVLIIAVIALASTSPLGRSAGR
jgi:hypothetical protein